MEIEQQLSASIKAAVKSLYDIELADKQVQLSPTRKEFEGHLTLMVFPFMKQTPVKNPELLGQAIGEWLVANEPLVAKFNVIKGFLNLSINAGSWVEKTRAQLIKEWIVTHILGRKLTDKIVQLKRKMKGAV